MFKTVILIMPLIFTIQFEYDSWVVTERVKRLLKFLDFDFDFTKRQFIELYFINKSPTLWMISKVTNSLAFIQLLYFKLHEVILFFTLRQYVPFSFSICNNFCVNAWFVLLRDFLIYRLLVFNFAL